MENKKVQVKNRCFISPIPQKTYTFTYKLHLGILLREGGQNVYKTCVFFNIQKKFYSLKII